MQGEATPWVAPLPRQVRARCETALWALGVPLVASGAAAMLWTRWAWIAVGVWGLWLVVILATARAHVRGLAWAVSDDAFLTRSGWLVSTVRSVPWSRVRSVELAEGIIDDRLGIASLTVKVPGSATLVQGLAPEAARALRDDLLARAQLRGSEDEADAGDGTGATPDAMADAGDSTAAAPEVRIDPELVRDPGPADGPNPPDDPGPADGPNPADDLTLPWFRAHPLSFVGESLSTLLALGGLAAYAALREAEDAPGILAWLGRTASQPRWSLLVVGIVGTLWAWSEVRRRRTTWALGADALHRRYVGRSRTHATVRLDRVDGVDVSSSLGARVLGLAQLRVLVSDGDEPMVLGPLRREQAEAMREQLLGRADETRAQLAPDAPLLPAPTHEGASLRTTTQTRTVLARTDRRTILTAFVLRDPVAPALVASLVVVAVALTVDGAREGLFFAAGAVAFAGRRVWGAFEKGSGRTIERAGGDLHVASGLATRTEKSVREGRVHAVRLSSRPQWWGADLWTVTALLGSEDGSDDDADDDELAGALLPAGAAAAALAVAQAAVPALARVDRRLLADLWPARAGVVVPDPAVDGAPVSVLRMPARAWWLAPLTWRARAAALAGDGLLVRTGLLAPRVTFVGLERVQGVSLDQGPLLRRADVVSVAVHLVDGPVAVDVGPLEPAAAAHLAATLAAAARRDRRTPATSVGDGTLSA